MEQRMDIRKYFSVVERMKSSGAIMELDGAIRYRKKFWSRSYGLLGSLAYTERHLTTTNNITNQSLGQSSRFTKSSNCLQSGQTLPAYCLKSATTIIALTNPALFFQHTFTINCTNCSNNQPLISVEPTLPRRYTRAKVQGHVLF